MKRNISNIFGPTRDEMSNYEISNEKARDLYGTPSAVRMLKLGRYDRMNIFPGGVD